MAPTWYISELSKLNDSIYLEKIIGQTSTFARNVLDFTRSFIRNQRPQRRLGRKLRRNVGLFDTSPIWKLRDRIETLTQCVKWSYSRSKRNEITLKAPSDEWIYKQDCLLIWERTTCEYVHLLTRVHFRSRDKDGGHTIRSVIVENPMLHANFMVLCFVERELLPIDRSFTLREYEFRDFRPWPDDLHIRTSTRIPWRYTDIVPMRKWTSYIHSFESYRLTDRQTDIHTDRQTTDRHDQNYFTRCSFFDSLSAFLYNVTFEKYRIT